MVAKRKAVAVRKIGGNNFRIPKVMVEEFIKFPIIDRGGTHGYWPVPVNILKKADFFKKLASDRQFMRDFDVLIVPRKR